ncbi:HU family DNA-binding protein [Donghicola sp. XS_ASV15]|uniref:HU family DNA-binding protein n=1 Tax=Donghicola sp. XS_ASV15 TaxID=3241295 RepID=UPI003516050C
MEEIDMTVVTTKEAAAAVPPLKKKELIEAVVAKLDMKKPEAKAAIEAVLEVLGDTLASGQSVNVPPLGKLMVKNMKAGANANVVNVRLRQSTASKADKPLAATDEQS